MRIDRLNLIAFGPFTDREIALDGSGVQIIYGPNGAGKSTSMRALEGLLFGIPVRTTDAWRHGMGELRIGARLLAADGTPLDIVRRKGNKQTLRGPDDAPIAEATLAALLGGTDLRLYQTMFSLSQEALRAGGDALLADQGDLGAALFGAGRGNASARELLNRLEDEAAALFKANGSKPKINAASRRYHEATRAVDQASVTANAWSMLDKQVRDAQRSRDLTAETMGDVRRKLARAERLLRVFVPVKERAGLLADLAELGTVPSLALDAEKQRLDAQRNLAAARKTRDRATTARDAAIRDLDGLRLDPAVIEREERIEQLREEVGRHRKNEQDLGRLRTEMAIAEDEAVRALQAVDPDASLNDDGPSLAIAAAEAHGVRSLAADHADLQAAVTSADRVLQDEERARVTLRDELDALFEAEDTAALGHATRTARAVGDLDAVVRHETAGVERAIAALRADVQRLPHVGDDLEAVVTLPVPLGATIDGFAEERSALAARAETLARDTARTDEEFRKVEDDLRRLELAGDVPTEDDLRRVRETRDQHWAGIRAAWLTDTTAGADDVNLAEEFGRDVVEADRTADRLRAESQRVAEKAQLVARRERLADDAERYRTENEALVDDRADHETRWVALWDPCGIAPDSPKAMATWAATHRELVRAAGALAEKRTELAGTEALRDEHRGVMARALGEVEATDRSLAALLEDAEARCEEADELRRSRTSLESRIRELDRKVATCKNAATKAREELTSWREAWAASVRVLDLESETSPAQALAVLDAIDAFCVRREKLVGLERRVAGLARDIVQFATDVDALRSSLAEPEGSDPAETIAALVLRLKRARAADHAARVAEEKRDAADGEIVEAEVAEREAERQFAVLRTTAGVASDDDLPAAEERWAQVRDLRSRLTECETRIRELGEGDLDLLVEAVEGADRDALTAEVEALTEEEAALAEERSRIDQELGTARGELRRVGGGDEAAAQADVAQQALAELAEHTERYVRVRMAAQLLRSSIETYREKTAGPVLSRANELFPELTNGDFTGVASDLGPDGHPVLLAVRGIDRVQVEHLSDGERDALYLALRVATLEHYFETSDPMPLILDDLMLNLDDDRAKAAFRILGSLTEVTQVLLFTHHRHLVELAQEALGDEGVRVLELAPVTVVAAAA